MGMFTSNMTEAEFDQLKAEGGIIANGWNSENMASCVVACNKNGTPVAMMISSKDTNYDVIYHRLDNSVVAIQGF
jgi:hypothetical protein